METVTGKAKYLLAFQHVLAMFGATVLVPALTGLDPSIAIFTAGVGTLLFHYCTSGKIPAFLGSSFAFISAVSFVLASEGIAYVKGGVICAGLVYVVMSLIIKTFGVDKVKSFFPPIVNGPIIMVIGLRLSGTATGMIGISAEGTDFYSLTVASIVVLTMITVSIFAKSFFKMVPILISIGVGYIAAILFDVFLGTEFINFTVVNEATWIGFSDSAMNTLLTLPKFSVSGVLAIAPVALVVFMEHIGDITTNGAVVGKDFFKDPGIHRSMLGDGLATLFAGLVGGPPNTTYGENTGVLAVTKVYDPKIIRIAAVFAIVLSLIGKVNGFIQSLPTAIMGGISIILFGMIASIGIRTLKEAELDFSHSRNLMIASIIFVTGIGIDSLILSGGLTISGLTIAAVLGVVLNKVLPENV
ncbi:MAG: uracil-xanthine permease family protein [Lachnospirales bacterium]